ncbi:MAG TPA: DUF5989 family protein, partial [Gemmatimonadaceae bacterium]|nr:DUF5989 family protein [Gemmatimonadaceae bacterium]
MSQSSLTRELWAFMKARKKWWLLPLIMLMLLVGTLLVFAKGSVLAPFIYTIFCAGGGGGIAGRARGGAVARGPRPLSRCSGSPGTREPRPSGSEPSHRLVARRPS